MGKQIVYFTSKDGNCTPCEEITKLVEEGKFHSPDTNEVDLIDISTDEGFKKFYEEILSKEDGGVPTAYMEGKKCVIVVEDGVVHFQCPSSDQPSDPEPISDPAEIET